MLRRTNYVLQQSLPPRARSAMGSLSSKNALVTGSTSGIGLA
ncbi:MAG: 3-hydroxybutyrate dehydrogenase, partial [Mesorhizobium sp.]